MGGRWCAAAERPHDRARWAHLRDERVGSSIGYVFPKGRISLASAERSGNWRALNDQQSDKEVRATFQMVSIPNGASRSYAYLLLPAASKVGHRKGRARSGVRVESNDAHAAAVLDKRANVYAANLWQAGSAPRDGKPFVSASGPAAVVVEQNGARLQLSVADPTQQQAALELTVARPVGTCYPHRPASWCCQCAATALAHRHHARCRQRLQCHVRAATCLDEQVKVSLSP
jgi:hyaluronate lyase